MRKILFIALSFLAVCATAANHVYVRSKQNLRCEGYFPQLSPDGKKVISAPTDAKKLYIYDLDTQKRDVVADEGVPGFEAIFGKNGKVYYVSMKINKDHLIFRSGREYDPESGSDREVLSPQHGAVHAINGTDGTAWWANRKNGTLVMLAPLLGHLAQNSIFIAMARSTPIHQ